MDTLFVRLNNSLFERSDVALRSGGGTHETQPGQSTGPPLSPMEGQYWSVGAFRAWRYRERCGW